MALIYLIDNDLLSSLRIEKTLQNLGFEVKTFTNPAAALETAAESLPVLVILNYGRLGEAAQEAILGFKALNSALPLLCFMPHVRMPELRPLAKAAGADRVVANSAIAARLPQLTAMLLQTGQLAGSEEEDSIDA